MFKSCNICKALFHNPMLRKADVETQIPVFFIIYSDKTILV